MFKTQLSVMKCYFSHFFSVCLLCICVHGHFPGGHDNFRKMIDEAEPLGYPVVVKNARGHRGKTSSLFPPVINSIYHTTPQKSVHSRPLVAAESTLI